MAETLGTNRQHEVPLGSLDHILHISEVSKRIRPKTVDELRQFLSEYHVAESLAYFIAQNETPKRGESERTVRLDTRLLHGYKPGAIIDAQFTYHPMIDDNNVFIFGRHSPRSTRAFNLRMHLRNDQELHPTLPLEAHIQSGGSLQMPAKLKVFRTQAYPEYQENRPRIFLSALQMAADGLASYVEARDNI